MKCRDLLPGDMYVIRISHTRSSAWLIVGRKTTLYRGEVELIMMNCWWNDVVEDRPRSSVTTQVVDVFSNLNETITVIRDGVIIFKGQRSS